MIKRKPKTEQAGSELPLWMITFSDLVTLLMTFFIVLVSMASLTDVYKRKVAIGSVSGTFGTGAPSLDDLTTKDSRERVDPGPMNVFKDLSPVKDKLWDDPEKDLRFESNRFMQRLSMDADALFAPGSAELTDKGRALLERLRPVVAESSHPLGLSGHTSEGLEEFGPEYQSKPWVKVDFPGNFPWRGLWPCTAISWNPESSPRSCGWRRSAGIGHESAQRAARRGKPTAGSKSRSIGVSVAGAMRLLLRRCASRTPGPPATVTV